MLTRLICGLLAICYSLLSFGQQDDQEYFDQLINKSSLEIFTNPEKAIDDYQKGIEKFSQLSDTLKVIELTCDMAQLYAQIADYSSSYDGYWESLILAEQMGNEEAKATVFNGLGWLYSFYKRNESAVHYFNESLAINKKNSDESPVKFQNIIDDYYALATLHRKDDNLPMARTYIDSCQNMLYGPLDNESNRSFILAEKGYLSYKENKLDQALQELKSAKVFFEQYDSSYLIILYPFLGDIYHVKDKADSSEFFYKRAIQISEIYKSHQDLIPEVYARLSKLYESEKKFQLAHEYLVLSNKMNEYQFGSRSIGNQGLLEIKDDFRVEMERQNELIQQQKLATLEQANKNRQLQLLILMLSLVFVVLSGILIYRNLTAKHRTEKKLIQQQRALELEKNKEILEAKNKELTSSALHVIEKEELLTETKNELLKQRSNPNPEDINRVIKSIDLSTNRSWKEFELRFLQVNKDFYNILREQFPMLSQNDHKICALIKLNFSSKDMSNLLGISVESVHTTRYRLRKKMGLDRKINLEDYIASLC